MAYSSQGIRTAMLPDSTMVWLLIICILLLGVYAMRDK